MGSVLTSMLLYVLVAIGLAVCVLAIIKAWIDGTLDAAVAVAVLTGLLALTVAIWLTQGTIWMFLFIALMVGGCAALPLFSAQLNKRALQSLREEDIEKYQRAINFDPKNAGAYAFLADAYLECGRYDEAVAAYEKAIELDSRFKDRTWKLKKAREAQQEKAQLGAKKRF